MSSGEWQEEVTAFGGKRRFRMIGNIKEYEPTITIDGVEVPESEVEAFNARRREAEKRRIETERAALNKPVKLCPFLSSGVNRQCKRDNCSFYNDGCNILRTYNINPTLPQKDTKGLYCPLSGRNCTDMCMMYSQGCKLA